MGTKANLLAGPWSLWQAATGTALPEINDLAPPTITVVPSGSWSQQGFTVDKHELEYEVEHEKVMVNEHNMTVKVLLIEEGAVLKVKFSENDLTHYSRAMSAGSLSSVSAAADQTAQTRLFIGDGTLVEKALLCVGVNPAGGSRLIHIPFAVPTGGVIFAASKKHGDMEYDVEWTIEGDPTASAGQRMIKIYDITAAASS